MNKYRVFLVIVVAAVLFLFLQHSNMSVINKGLGTVEQSSRLLEPRPKYKKPWEVF